MIKGVGQFVVASVSYICWVIVIRFLSLVQAWSSAKLFSCELTLSLINRSKSLLRLLFLRSLLDRDTLVCSLVNPHYLFIIILIFIEYWFQSLTLQPRVVHWLECGSWLVIEPLLVKVVSDWGSLVVFRIMGCQILLKSYNTLIVQIVWYLYVWKNPWWGLVDLAISIVLLF